MRQTLQRRTSVQDTVAKEAAEPIAVRIDEAVRLSGFSRSRLYIMAARGEVTFRKCGKAVLVDFGSLKAAVAALPVAKIRGAA